VYDQRNKERVRSANKEEIMASAIRELTEKRKENLLKSGKGKNSMNEGGLKPSGPMGTILNVDGRSVEGFIGSDIDHWASLISGTGLATYGVISAIKKPTVLNVLATLAGGALVYRGLTGLVYNDEMASPYLDGMSNPNAATQHLEGIKVEHSITINRPPSEIYSIWRNFSNLPRIMTHLESVQETNEIESHWVAKAPAGTSVEWDAEVYMEKVGELISWRSAENADVDNAGSVRFEAVGDNSTKLTVMLKYDPPMGPIGAAIAKLFGEEPTQQIGEDLKNFKKAIEAGEFDEGGSKESTMAMSDHSRNGHSSNGVSSNGQSS
jgi:uncharacterized membrane protein